MHAPPFLPPALALAAFAVAYPLLDWVSFIYPMAPFNITPWNPQPALAIALLALYGQRWLPLVALVVALTEYLIRNAAVPVGVDVGIALVLSLAYAGIARLLTQHYPVSARLDCTRDVLRLTAVVIGGAMLTSLLYVGLLAASGAGSLASLPEAILRFWIGDSVGVLVFLPPLLMLADEGRRSALRQLLKRPEVLAQALLLVALLLFIFSRSLDQQVKFFYLLFLPLVWVSVRHGLLGSSVAALLIQTGVIAAVHFTGQPSLTVYELQGFLIAMMIMCLFLGVSVDERTRAERALQRSQRLAAAGQMAAVLTHELGQPLTALANYARAGQLLLAAGPAEGTRLEDTLRRLVAESRRTAEVVRRLRDFLQHGQLRKEPVDLVALIERVVASQRDEGALTPQRVMAAGLPGVMADPLQLEIVLRNLLRNAVEAARSGLRAPQVRLHLDRRGQELQLAIADSGRGVAREQAEQIFEPFETGKTTGMGMGLAVSRAIIEAHRGRLWVDTTAEGGLFYLTLPIEEDHDVARTA